MAVSFAERDRLDAVGPTAPVSVSVETLVFFWSAGSVAYLAMTRPWDRGPSPESAIWRPDGSEAGIAYEHSTSWRTIGSRSIVLTYAVVPDLVVLPSYLKASPEAPFDLISPATGPFGVAEESDSRVIPTEITTARVAWHAARHLAFLARSEEAWEPGRQTASPEFWERVRNLPHGLAGQLEAERAE